ncbi:hypothetical protein GQ53DRAFT_789065 [Thozetella sp. PMI_491]|nr:hypothetical protein GQ53DRAFT_789065 [Thozetella sp. PMI_491]
MRDTSRSDMPRFVGSGTGIHFIRGVYTALAVHHAGQSRRSSPQPSNLVPGEDDQLGDDPVQRNSRCLWHPGETTADLPCPPPSFEQLVAWSRSYFELWHPALPFLHAPGVLDVFEEVSRKGLEALSVPSSLILRSVLSISLADSRQGTKFEAPIPSYLVFVSIDEALSSVQSILQQPASVYLTQAAVCVQLFLMSMLHFNSASRLGGLIVRVAFHLGLHRCPARFPSFKPDEVGMRRRLFWCIYILERRLCQSLGLPLDLPNDDIDVCYADDEQHSLIPRSTDPSTRSEASRLRLMTYLAKHANITGLILELRNKSVNSRQDTPDHVDRVTAELARWANEIHDAVDEDLGADSIVDDGHGPFVPPLPPAHRLLLLVLKQESVIALNRPMMAAAPGSPAYAAALQNCIAASRSIISLFSKFYDMQPSPIGQPKPSLVVPMVWPSFPWAIWMSAFVLVYGAFEGQLPLESFRRHAEQSTKVLIHLAARDTSWPEYCRSAVKSLVAAIEKQAQTTRHNLSARSPGGEDVYDQVSSEPALTDRGQHSTPPENVALGSSFDARDRATSQVGQTQSTPGTSTGDTADFRQPELLQSTPSNHPQAGSRCHHTSCPGNSHQEQSRLHGNIELADTISPHGGHMGQNMVMNFDTTEQGLGTHLTSSWYQEMVTDSFSAIDYPFLAAAQLDPFMDPILSFAS